MTDRELRELLHRRFGAPAPTDPKIARDLAAWERELADVPTWDELEVYYR